VLSYQTGEKVFRKLGILCIDTQVVMVFNKIHK